MENLFEKLKTTSRAISPIHSPSIFIVGIFGSRKGLSEIDLHENILSPILSSLGRVPDKLLMPSDNSAMSVFVEDWAKNLRIPCYTFKADFRTSGKSAAIFRDARIQSECTVAIVFQAPRTTRYDLLAERMARKGKRVFFIEMNGQITEYV
jgi:hypothetical protein